MTIGKLCNNDSNVINDVKISVLTSLYNGLEYLEKFFECYIAISNIAKTELIIIHNSPTEAEKKIINKYAPRIPYLTYLEVPREVIYESWNRGIQVARGKYIAMWNVDDRRTQFSLEEQARLLDSDATCMIATGDYYKVFNYGDEFGYYKTDPVKKGIFNRMPKFNNGCFLMWRKSVHNDIGYFDEQYKISGDTEFWFRMTRKFSAKSTNTILGYYLRVSGKGLSKRKKRNDVEYEITCMRYHNIFAINVYKLITNNTIRYSKIKNYSAYMPIQTNKYLLLRLLPSIVFFWLRPVTRIMVKLKYFLLERNKYIGCLRS